MRYRGGRSWLLRPGRDGAIYDEPRPRGSSADQRAPLRPRMCRQDAAGADAARQTGGRKERSDTDLARAARLAGITVHVGRAGLADALAGGEVAGLVGGGVAHRARGAVARIVLRRLVSG